MLSLLFDPSGKSAWQHLAKSLFAKKDLHMWQLDPLQCHGPSNFLFFSILFATAGQPVTSMFIQVPQPILSDWVVHPVNLQPLWMKNFLIPNLGQGCTVLLIITDRHV